MINREQGYTTELERLVLTAVENQVNGLPSGTAECYIGPNKGDPRMNAPVFEIVPTNPKAARIGGAVLEGEGVTISVGHSRRELGYNLTNASAVVECASFVADICQAVFAGNFAEDINENAGGRIISSSLRLRVRGRVYRLWRNRLITDLVTITKKKRVIYEPYVTSAPETPLN